QRKIKDLQIVFRSPGMSEKCKVNLVISRQNILLIGRLIEAGLLSKNNQIEDEILAAFKETFMEEFKSIHEEILRQSELTEFYYRLKLL
ncbi:MAG: hypothetical protein ABJB11_24935, partial [Ferruginibacter sp.]